MDFTIFIILIVLSIILLYLTFRYYEIKIAVVAIGISLVIALVIFGNGIKMNKVDHISKIQKTIDANTVQIDENRYYLVLNKDNDDGLFTIGWIYLGLAFILFIHIIWELMTSYKS